MANKRDSRRAKARQKQKRKRQTARKTRGSRVPAGVHSESLDAMGEASRWPLGECYLSEDWYERGATLHAAFVRGHADGRSAAAFFEVDLAERGVVRATSASGVQLAAIQGELVRMSEDGRSMVNVPAARVVKLVRAAEAWASARGHGAPDGLQRASTLFGEVSSADCDDEFLFGTEAEPSTPPPAEGGLLAGIKRRLGLS